MVMVIESIPTDYSLQTIVLLKNLSYNLVKVTIYFTLNIVYQFKDTQNHNLQIEYK